MSFSWFSKAPFTPETDIPSLDGKVIIITGSNGGLGKAQLTHLAKHGGKATFYMGARSRERAEAAIKDIKEVAPNADVRFLEMDLTSFDSVKKAADTFLAENNKLDFLINNAGIMAHPPGLTKENYEIQFGTNHMGHFLFTKLLLPTLLKTAEAPNADVRIINLSSEGHKMAPKGGLVLDVVKSDMADYSTLTRYGQSKLSNILFTTELARRYPSITSIAIHPGGVDTGLADQFRRGNAILGAVVGALIPLFATPVEKGAWNQTWATVADVEGGATTGTKSTAKVKNGAYYCPVAKGNGDSAYAKDAELAKTLWEWSEKEVAAKGF